MKCKHCNQFEAVKGRDQCAECFAFLHGRERRELNKALSTGNLFLLFDILNGKHSFKELKSNYRSDGALASNIATLEKRGFLVVLKEFRAKKPFTTYDLTQNGKDLIEKFVKVLADINLGKCEIPACGNDVTVGCQICFRAVCSDHEVSDMKGMCSICKKETDEHPITEIK